MEGFYDESYSILKILQKVSDGNIRHIIPIDSVNKSKDVIDVVASKFKRELVNIQLTKDILSGCVVHIKDINGKPVTDREGNILKYQVVAVYAKQARVKLVTHYGEEIGMYNIEDVIITEEDPLFKMEDYEVGQEIMWIEYDDVYEGVITKLHSSTAEVSNIKKLHPTDFRRKIPYYKISDKYNDNVLITIKDLHNDF